MSWTDSFQPIKVHYYAFGSGTEDVKLMGIDVEPADKLGKLVCREKIVDGVCVQDCHDECNGKL